MQLAAGSAVGVAGAVGLHVTDGSGANLALTLLIGVSNNLWHPPASEHFGTSVMRAIEQAVGKPIVSSDSALYWRIFKTLGLAPTGEHGQLLSTLS